MSMEKRFVSIYFGHLITDWFTLHQPGAREIPFVVTRPSQGGPVILAANALAEIQGIFAGMSLTDARALLPSLQCFSEKPGLSEKLLRKMAEWCIRFSPTVAIDLPDGLLIDASGCTHLWGGDSYYLTAIAQRFKARGYTARVGIADTVGAAWAITRFGHQLMIHPQQQLEALLPLPPDALRLPGETISLLKKLGLKQIGSFINIPRVSLRRRFGELLLQRLDQALGQQEEWIEAVNPAESYSERLPCLEPILTAGGIEYALNALLEKLCQRLLQEQKGLRQVRLKTYRIDGESGGLEIGTSRASRNPVHLFQLFGPRLQNIEPGMGIELFVLEALKIEDLFAVQEKIWENTGGLKDRRLAELIDRLSNRMGRAAVRRYLPDEHYWPERSVKPAASLEEEPTISWRTDQPRPLQLLPVPEPIEVTAPIPDYPPMLFRHRGKLHKISRADGPERIEQEWWLQEGEHRDYYRVEDDQGCRYWVFRSGHYTGDRSQQWFLHGFFA